MNTRTLLLILALSFSIPVNAQIKQIHGAGDLIFVSGFECCTATTTMSSFVTKDAITWTFDSEYEIGQFVNGDYYVVDSGLGVIINSVSPISTGTGVSFRNGSVVNPAGNSQGYDGRVTGYDGNQSESFPLTLNAGDSLVSTENQTGNGTDVYGNNFQAAHALISDVSVLTVVNNAPLDKSFRPPFVGVIKPLYHASSLNTGLLPTLTLNSKPSLSFLAEVTNWYKRPWLDHMSGWEGRKMHAVRNMPNYGREIGHASSIASSLLMLDYTLDEKNELLISYIQTGIDLYWMTQTGTSWNADGGHSNGRKWPIIFAGILFNDNNMKTFSLDFAEDGQTYYGVTTSMNAGQNNVAFFGKDGNDMYYQNSCTGGGPKDVRPSTLDDDACHDYRNCCTSYTWVGTTLSVLMMNEKSLWNHDAFFDYVDRWMGYGNDPQVVNAGFVSPGTTSADFIGDMWAQYRSNY